MSNGILLNLSSDNRTADSVGTDDFVIHFASPLKLGSDQWEMSMVSANFWNANPNISGPLYNNDFFSYSPDGVIWKVITLPEGTYSIQAINAEVQRQIAANGDIAANVLFAPNSTTLKAEITTVAPYEVDLGTGSLLYDLLGFTLAQVAAPLTGYNTGALRANINRGVNNIYLHCDLVDSAGSYDSSKGSDILTDLAFQGRAPGQGVYIEKKYQMWLPVKKDQFVQTVRVRMTDQLNRRYSIRDEPMNVQIYLRPAKMERNRKLFENFTQGIKSVIPPPK